MGKLGYSKDSIEGVRINRKYVKKYAKTYLILWDLY